MQQVEYFDEEREIKASNLVLKKEKTISEPNEKRLLINYIYFISFACNFFLMKSFFNCINGLCLKKQLNKHEKVSLSNYVTNDTAITLRYIACLIIYI